MRWVSPVGKGFLRPPDPLSASGPGWWDPCPEPRQPFMHSSSDAKLLALPWQPPYQKRLHRPTEATKYQRACQWVQEPRALGSRHRTGYAEERGHGHSSRATPRRPLGGARRAVESNRELGTAQCLGRLEQVDLPLQENDPGPSPRGL